MKTINHAHGMWAIALIVFSCFLFSPASVFAGSGKKMYFEIRGVQTPANAPAGLKEQAKALLISELKKYPQVLLDLGNPPPTGDDIEKALKKNKAQGYAVILRITKAQSTVKPAAPGKIYQTLSAEIALAIDADKIPAGTMALAGEGSSEVATEIKKVDEKERQSLMADALIDSLSKAVKQTVIKMSSTKKDPPAKSARKKR